MRVRPATKGHIIRDPHTKRQLPDEGGEVPDTIYWQRKLARGEVVPVDGDEPRPVSPENAPVAGLATRPVHSGTTRSGIEE